MALTDWKNLSPEMKRRLIEDLQAAPRTPSFVGVDLGRPGGDHTAFAWRLPDGTLSIETICSDALDRIGQPKPVDLELQPDGSYAPAKR